MGDLLKMIISCFPQTCLLSAVDTGPRREICRSQRLGATGVESFFFFDQHQFLDLP